MSQRLVRVAHAVALPDALISSAKIPLIRLSGGGEGASSDAFDGGEELRLALIVVRKTRTWSDLTNFLDVDVYVYVVL